MITQNQEKILNAVAPGYAHGRTLVVDGGWMTR
jgi:hypothetical protein